MPKETAVHACACGHPHPHDHGARPHPVGAQVALSGRLTCTDAAHLMALLSHVGAHVDASRAEPGCLHFQVFQTDDPLAWQLEALFRDPAALEAHRARTRQSAWWTATAGIPRTIREIAAEAVSAKG